MINAEHQTVISYFDIHIGPRILYADLENNERNKFAVKEEEITKLMDIHNTGDFFVHYFNNFFTINYCFSVLDPLIRGGSHQFMASLVFKDLKDDGNSIASIFSNMNEFKKWAQNIKRSIQKSTLAKSLVNSKVTHELNDINHDICNVENALFSSLKRRSY